MKQKELKSVDSRSECNSVLLLHNKVFNVAKYINRSVLISRESLQSILGLQIKKFRKHYGVFKLLIASKHMLSMVLIICQY